MTQYVDKSDVIVEIDKLRKNAQESFQKGNSTEEQYYIRYGVIQDILSSLDTLEVKDPYEQCIQYPSIKDGIKAHAETYSFNIESKLFNQLTEEQQELWRKEIEQACISGGDAGVELARDPRYKENLKVKDVDLKEEFDNYAKNILACDVQFEPFTHLYNCAKHFYELGLKAQKGG